MAKCTIVFILLVAVLSVILCSCDINEFNEEYDLYNNEDITNEQAENGFIITSVKYFYKEDLTQYTMYDPETMVMYAYMDGYNSAGMSVIYGANGLPRLYSHQK